MSTAMNDLLASFLDETTPFDLAKRCSVEQLDIINKMFNGKYDAKIKKGLQLVLRWQLDRILYKFDASLYGANISNLSLYIFDILHFPYLQIWFFCLTLLLVAC
jgi:hypothetical protein